ncbi:phosphatidylglycerol:prolipoprotein diacylglycerol transferase [Thermosyntropha lipolytica DSM 11003]|uniref:Phosphatidylglycerol--prolipoprotein diacylglyceryl transferase n=1 Tax=Thermosyntropha lipolytica DSM 11003 TaxID=1123382 RepID=A0A1M5JEB6_9FIRM|nr:phosphatidylglycerol:prolipoprotein diacylglycerol transferase [Thermosyntropha lipolytica DSM 11003]
MYPVLLKLGPFTVYSWGVMLALAVIIGVWGVGRLFAREGFSPDTALSMTIIMIIAGVIGGRAAYILIYEWQDLLRDPASVLFTAGLSGLIWYGGFVGGFIAYYLYVKKHKLPFFRIADMFAPYIALGYAIVRVGCFFNGCCYGGVTDSVCGVVFPYVDGFHRHPTQLYSSFLNLVLFGVLWWLYPRRKFEGQVFAVYIIGYSVYRFIIEFFRESLINYGMFTLGQLYTGVLFIIGVILYKWLKMRFYHEQRTRW